MNLREAFSVSLGDQKGTKRIDRTFEGCIALYGGLIKVPNR